MTLEGVFAMVKEDMGFRRFLLRSTVKVEVEWTLLSLAYNVLKLHHKIQTGRLGTGFRPDYSPSSNWIQKNHPGALLFCGTPWMVFHIFALSMPDPTSFSTICA